MHIKTSPMQKPAAEISFEDFLRVDVRIGEIISAEVFKEARKPAYILMINFGDVIGLRKSSAQITQNYSCEELVGKRVAAVVNLAPRQIGSIMSEVLTLGFADENGSVVLFSPDKNVPLGSRLH